MTTETRIEPRKNFVPRFLPWLLAAAALAVYWFTLNRWVSLPDLEGVARISGWTWLPELANPLLFLVTCPFRWLPATQVPIALNVFSAVCAAATLGLLARSVALLPHDRTDAQRRRERSDFSFLTIGSAWLPPILAVAVCGLQLTFWEHATNFTGDMFDLLLFAFVIWLLLEYRLDERAGRLYLAVAVYGAGMAENWGMVGFLPVFIAAIIWIRGLAFFNLRFLQGMVLCGLAGMSLVLLLPIWAVVSGKIPGAFGWLALKSSLVPQYNVLKYFFLAVIHPQQYFEVLLLVVAYLIPLFVLAIRWQSSFGDSSQMGMALASFMFHVVHAIILFICLWLVFDPTFSPREKGFGLTFYYLIALSVGYYSGYFLLVFGKKASGRSQPPPPPSPLQFLNPFLVAGVFVLGGTGDHGAGLQKRAAVRRVNVNASEYRCSGENLPRAGAFFSDDPRHLSCRHWCGMTGQEFAGYTHWLAYPAIINFCTEISSKVVPIPVPARRTRCRPCARRRNVDHAGHDQQLFIPLHPSSATTSAILNAAGLVYKLQLVPRGDAAAAATGEENKSPTMKNLLVSAWKTRRFPPSGGKSHPIPTHQVFGILTLMLRGAKIQTRSSQPLLLASKDAGVQLRRAPGKTGKSGKLFQEQRKNSIATISSKSTFNSTGPAGQSHANVTGQSREMTGKYHD